MDEFYEGGNTHLRGESKEGIIEAVLPQRASFDRKEGSLLPYVWFLPKHAYILTLFGRQPVQERRSTGTLKR